MSSYKHDITIEDRLTLKRPALNWRMSSRGKVQLLILCMIFLSLQCRTVEVSVPGTTLTILLKGDLRAIDLAPIGPEIEVTPGTDGIYQVKTPTMDGGYSEFAFVLKYNRHDPQTYPVVALRRNKQLIRELSLSDIYALPRTRENFTLSLPQ